MIITPVNSFQSHYTTGFSAQTYPNNQPAVEKESNKGKALLITSLAIIGTVGIVLVCRARGLKGQKILPRQDVEHIEFKDCKTIEEAQNFAKENFNTELDVGDNLFAANLINECCTHLFNKQKNKAYFPRKFKLVEENKETEGTNFITGYYTSNENIIRINKNLGKSINVIDIVFNNGFIKSEKNYSEYVNSLNDSMKKLFNRYQKTIFHELGHCCHHANCKNASKMRPLEDLKKAGENDTHFTTEFLEKIKDNDLQNEFADSPHAFKSPTEFIATIFAKQMQNQSVSTKAMQIYTEYEGLALAK